jgi:hypothetical protein
MVILAARSSGKSFNCRRLLIGIKMLEAPFTYAYLGDWIRHRRVALLGSI